MTATWRKEKAMAWVDGFVVLLGRAQEGRSGPGA